MRKGPQRQRRQDDPHNIAAIVIIKIERTRMNNMVRMMGTRIIKAITCEPAAPNHRRCSPTPHPPPRSAE